MTAPGVDSCSLVPLFVEAYYGDQPLGIGTAFLWLRTDLTLALVTNWHVVSGRNHETGKCLNKMGGLPDRLCVHVPYHERRAPPVVVTVPTLNGEGEPVWTEHPRRGSAVDVVALPIALPPPSEVSIMPMNAIRSVPLKQRIGMPLFILGFPFGRTGIGMPVWKQASFASEPILSPGHDHPYLTVDTASRPGMSGSPAIQRVHGQIELEGDLHGRMSSGDGACCFVGIYSGRFHTEDSSDAQLGRVWPAILVEEIIAGM